MEDLSIRLSRRATNFLYRYDSLRNNQIQELERALDIVEDLQLCSLVITIMVVISIIPQNDNILEETDQQLILFMEQAVLLEIGWLMCLSELLLLEIEDSIYYSIHRRPIPSERFSPQRNNQIDSFDDETADDFFGFSVYNLRRLHLHWRIPERFYNDNGNGIQMFGEECFLMYLCFIRKGEPYTTMAQLRFGGDPRRLTFAVRAVAEHLYSTFYHKVSGDSMRQWISAMHTFREAVWRKLVDGVLVELEHGRQVRHVHVRSTSKFHYFWIPR